MQQQQPQNNSRTNYAQQQQIQLQLQSSQEELEQFQLFRNKYCLKQHSFRPQDDLIKQVKLDFSNTNQHPNKKHLYETALKYMNYQKNQNLHFFRYKAIPLPPKYPSNQGKEPKFEGKKDAFSYEPLPPEKANIFEWYLNFADPFLFAAYRNPEYYIDETQCNEHPILGFVNEKLNQLSQTNEKDAINWQPRTMDLQTQHPTPCLVINAQRTCQLNKNIYRQDITKIQLSQVKTLIQELKQPTLTNFICMSALSKKQGKYTEQQIVITLLTAFTAFKAAVIEAKLYFQQNLAQTLKPTFNNENLSARQQQSQQDQLAESASSNTQVEIHTGNWGTGAFGGDCSLMLLIQMLAADMANVDRVTFHTFNDQGMQAYALAEKHFKNIKSQSTNIEEVINKIYSLEFKWAN